MDEMSLETWVEEEKERIARFAAYYRKAAAQAMPDQDWPMFQAPGEWDEQYRSFAE